jgi:hypothetical protein
LRSHVVELRLALDELAATIVVAPPSQQRPDTVQLAVRDTQALPELHVACPVAHLHEEFCNRAARSVAWLAEGRGNEFFPRARSGL